MSDSVVSSVRVSVREEVDGRLVVHEEHLLTTGQSRPLIYLIDATADLDAALVAHAVDINAALAAPTG